MGAPRTIKGRAKEIARRLTGEYPAECALVHRNPFELVVATILSAQCTDERVNMVTPEVFRRWPGPAELAAADPAELEEVIYPTGFFRNKAKSLLGLGRTLCDRFDGEVPTDLADLVTLPGVGRKTGNVVRSVAFGLPGLPVDTHVGRLTRRLGLTASDDPVKVEREIAAMLPPKEWGGFSLRCILHGRQVCLSRKPRCDACLLEDLCPSSTLPSSPARTRARRRPARTVRPTVVPNA
ncbi:MAG: endonuclease III [Acidimicrobiia bacterium]